MSSATLTHPPSARPLTPATVRLFAFCCGVVVANIYYAQPIVELIAPQVGLSLRAASLIVALTQVGYAAGLFLLVPLGDIVENRRLIMLTVLLAIVGLVAAASAQDAPVFVAATLLIGVTSVSVQMLIPLAAHLTPEASRGRVVGSVMAGLLLGILLSRPLASVVADHFGWRAVFIVAAVLMAGIAAIVALALPRFQPAGGLGYGALLGSLVELLRDTPVLRERAFYQACMFATFSLFWTTVPIELAHHHGFSQSQIALFTLVGAVGVVAGPLGGRLADAGHSRLATWMALSVAFASWMSGLLPGSTSVLALVLTAVLLDGCAQVNMVVGQRAIYTLPAPIRSRLNALYMTSIFLGGAVGSASASVLYVAGGWRWVAVAGCAFPLAALARSALGTTGRP